jgi:hypothetical protein
MPLDDLEKIDLELGPTAHAKVTLVITDGQPHADQQRRLEKLVDKIQAYVSYVVNPQFAERHKGVKPADVLICAVCHDPPTEMMKKITSVRPAGDTNPDNLIRVVCVEHRPGMPLPEYFTPRAN